MKRLLITLDFPPEKGGIQRYLYDIVARSYHEGDRVMVGCAGASHLPATIGAANVRYYSWIGSRWNKKLSLIPLLFGLMTLHSDSTDLVIDCGNIYAAVAAWCLSLFAPRPYRVYTYGTELLALEKRSIRSAILRQVLNRALTIYVLGPYTQSLLLKARIDRVVETVRPRITIPPNALTWHPPVRTEPFAILMVARMVPHKGHRILFESVALLPSDIPWSLTLVGNGPERGAVDRICRDTNLEHRVTIRPGVDETELHKLYQSASVVVLPSLEIPTGTEGFGIVLLEAMAFSVPVVASRTGGIVDVVDNGSCGVLVEPGNARALADAIADIYRNPREYAAMTRRAHARVCTDFSRPQERL